MARDFFIAPRIGSGTRGDPYRAKVPGNITGHVSTCNATQCLVLVTGDVSGAHGDPELTSLFGDDLSVSPMSLPPGDRARIQATLVSAGIPLTLTDYATLHDFLQDLGEVFDPNFRVENFWVVGE